MLIETNYKDKNKSIYKCDKCRKEILGQVEKIIFNNRTYHLCDKHYKILNDWIKNIKKERG